MNNKLFVYLPCLNLVFIQITIEYTLMVLLYLVTI